MRLPKHITQEEKDYRATVKTLDRCEQDMTYAKFGVRSFYHKFKNRKYTKEDILNHIEEAILKGKEFAEYL